MLEDYRGFAMNLKWEHNYSRTLTKFTGKLPPAYSCPQSDHCLGGIDSACSEGTTGPLCAVCTSDHFRINGDCFECPDSREISIVISIVIFAIVLVVGAAGIRHNAKGITTAMEEAAQASNKARNSRQLKRRRSSKIRTLALGDNSDETHVDGTQFGSARTRPKLDFDMVYTAYVPFEASHCAVYYPGPRSCLKGHQRTVNLRYSVTEGRF